MPKKPILILFAVIFSIFCLAALSGCQKQSVAALYDVESAAPSAQAPPSASPAAQDSDAPQASQVPPAPSPTPAPPSPSPTPEPVLADWTGGIEHIFFHPLVAYPQLAFDGDSLSQGYDDWFVTVDEFKKILDSLYAKGYILVDINALIDTSAAPPSSGTSIKVTRARLMLPDGKKPLVLSVDDLNYYDYMRKNGDNYKLVLDQNGDVAAYSKDPLGNEVISRDNEIIPIVDNFVSQHPDFSLNGAKGTICETGYEGVLGYRTDLLDSPTYARDKADAMAVVARLKATGWNFASHGYFHRHMNGISYSSFVEDTDRWLKEVAPIIGQTQVFVYPFGEFVDSDTTKFAYLEKKGFRIYCGVGIKIYNRWAADHLYMDRADIDGYAMRNHKADISRFFDPDAVLDRQARAQYLPKKGSPAKPGAAASGGQPAM